MSYINITNGGSGDLYLWDESVEGYMAQSEYLEPGAQNQNKSAQIEPGFEVDPRKSPPSSETKRTNDRAIKPAIGKGHVAIVFTSVVGLNVMR
jgi:hypothetical protein